ncbi:IS66 family insertion sequence element accessory protein TnpB [Paenibacillus xanthanilyticus]|uniref:IS66 family insertion sequence element accessory protein TnpB n=1 Tax=Paenibacillus xanthanilyticus TaxID=1783531 RepID=A0ABV8K7T5_9BACL
MLSLSSAHRVYLACGATKPRKSIDGLDALVQTSFGLDPFPPCLFVFCNRQRNKLKILCWEHNGFWVFYRRIERGTFQWPSSNETTLSISSRCEKIHPDQLELNLFNEAVTLAPAVNEETPFESVTYIRKKPGGHEAKLDPFPVETIHNDCSFPSRTVRAVVVHFTK